MPKLKRTIRKVGFRMLKSVKRPQTRISPVKGHFRNAREKHSRHR